MTLEENKTIFKLDKKDIHYFIEVFNRTKLKQIKVQNIYNKYNKDNWNVKNYKTSPMPFGRSRYIIVIKEFKSSEDAMNYYSTINDNPNTLSELKNNDNEKIVISKVNFDIFYSTKSLDEYLSFFQNNYILTTEDE